MPGNTLNDTERRLLERWNDNFGPSLRTLEITGQGLRGIHNATIDFKYPLTVIAGKNGVGKSTILACACCAYRNTSPFRTLMSQKPYFNPSDFLVRGWGDTSPRDVGLIWTYRRADTRIAMADLRKQTEWGGYQKRLDRPVEYLGTIRTVHPCELNLLRSKFRTNSPEITSTTMTAEQRNMVGRIVGRDYSSVQIGATGRHRLHRLEFGGARYSAFHAGSGEDISCLISRAIEHLPNGGLLAIEEVEMGLHPAAQRQLAAQLLEACWEREIQVICTSHSSDFLAAVPTDARVLVSRGATSLDARYGVTVAEATTDLQGFQAVEMVICVEDRVAERLMLELTPSRTRVRLGIVSCGSWEDVLRHLSAYLKHPSLGHAIGILDGDRRGKEGDHFGRFKNHIGGRLTDQQRTWLTQRLYYLPGLMPPEKWLWALGRDSGPYLDELARELNADTDDLRTFFQEPIPTNHHNLPLLLSRRVGNDPEAVLSGLSRAAVRTQATELNDVLSYIESQLAAG